VTDHCFKIQVKSKLLLVIYPYQYSVHNSLLHLLCNFQNAITQQNIAENCNSALFNALYFHNERAEQQCYQQHLMIDSTMCDCCIIVCIPVTQLSKVSTGIVISTARLCWLNLLHCHGHAAWSPWCEED